MFVGTRNKKKSKTDTGKNTKAPRVSLSNMVRPHISFKRWRRAAYTYLHMICRRKLYYNSEQTKNMDAMLGDDEDMIPSYNDGETPQEYVDYQFECAA
jgi:hypothetical protein